jgi:hypothetical protein
VKNAFAQIGAATLIVLAVGLMSGSAFAAGMPTNPDLKGIVKWAVWHEGCRIYSADNSIGDVEDIRSCMVSVYAQNEYAQERLREANKNSLFGAIRAAAMEIPDERQFGLFVEFACKNSGLLNRFKQMVEAEDFDGIRSLYYATFKSHEEIRNVLAAVSDRELRDFINHIGYH